jgi:hypothetical protein
MNSSVPPGLTLGAAAGDLERQQEVSVESVARLLEVHIEHTSVVRLAGRHHHVVNGGRQVTEELLEGSRVVGVEGRGAQRVELACGALETLRIPAGKDDLRPLGACSSCRFQPDAGASADHDDGLPEELRFALRGDVAQACDSSELSP